MSEKALDIASFIEAIKDVDKPDWDGHNDYEVAWEIEHNNLYEREIKIWNAGFKKGKE
jgi:hypothetical protein